MRDRSIEGCYDIAILQRVGVTIYRKQPLGFGQQGLLLVLPMTVPNNTLPLLH